MSHYKDLSIKQQNKDRWDLLLEAIDLVIENTNLTIKYIKR